MSAINDYMLVAFTCFLQYLWVPQKIENKVKRNENFLNKSINTEK